MIYATCPSCGKLLGDKQLKYESSLEKIINDTKMTEEQKESAKQKLIQTIVERYCCRMRIMSYVDYAKLGI